MARFKFGRKISLRWNGLLIEGPAETVFEIPDEYYEEFEQDIHPVEPTLVWLDSDEGATLRGRVTALENSSGSAVTLSNATPLALGTAAPGTGTGASRYDHIHPTTGLSLSSHNHSGVYDPAGTASSALSAHTSASDPHPVYLTQAEADAFYAALSHSHTGLAAAYTSVVQQYVKNDATAKSKGEVVYISSANGTNPIISYANATTEATSSKTLGLLIDNVAANGFVYVITEGILSGINTSAATAGQSVWLDTTDGQRKYGSPPADPANSVYLGVVTKANASTGEVFVKIQNGYELDELHDVAAGTPTAGDIIQWATDGTTYMWRKKSLADAGISATSHAHSGVYDPAGTAASTVSTHAAVTTSVHGITNTANLVYTSDSRLSDSRTPTAHKTTHATGGSDALTASDIGAATSGHTHSYASTTHASTHTAAGSDPLSSLSPSQITGTAVITTDSRLSDSRTPTAHKATHATGGSDALTPADIGAALSSHTHSYASTTHASTHAAAGSDPLSGISPSQITGTAVITTDSRLSDARTPLSHTHTQSESHNSADTDTGTSSLHHTIGTGANQAAAGNHTHSALTPAGVVNAYMGASTNIPSGWLLCNGQSVSTTTYAALFAVIGYSFGGSGSSFTIPDLTGNLLVGWSGTPATGFQTGSTDAYLNASWTHAHSHSHSTNPAATASGSPSTVVTSLTQTGSGQAGSNTHTHTTDIAATTSDTDATNSPTITVQRTRVNYIIKT